MNRLTDIHIRLSEMTPVAISDFAAQTPISKAMRKLGQVNWQRLLAPPVPVIRLVLIDQDHRKDILGKPVSALFNDVIADKDTVAIIALGAPETVIVSAGIQYRELASRILLMPAAPNSGEAPADSTDNHSATVLQAIEDLHVINGEPADSRVVVYPYVDWRKFPNTYYTLLSFQNQKHLKLEIANNSVSYVRAA